MRVVGIMSWIGGWVRCDGCRGVMGVTSQMSEQVTQGKVGSWCSHFAR